MIMDLQPTIMQQILRVGERVYTPQSIYTTVLDELPEAEAVVVRWLRQWWDGNPKLLVSTSGSTGIPKQLWVDKARMLYSAQMTCMALGLGEQDRALLAMDLRYIGAMMLVVRCLVSGMSLVVRKATSNPLRDIALDEAISFAALVPLQVYEILRDEASSVKFSRIRQIIIGGGGLDPKLEQHLRLCHNTIYSTYGMTETLSHIALRRICPEPSEADYTPLPGISVFLSPIGTLGISAPGLLGEPIVTNDLAVLRDNGQFRILGRRDCTINSGGIKIQLEQLEAKITEMISEPFALSWRADERLGQALVLVVVSERSLEELRRSLGRLSGYDRPRDIVRLASLPTLPSGKLDRIALQALLASHTSQDPRQT